MKNLIQKYRNKYPRWLFLWLIKKHWLFPEPMVFSDMITISELYAVKTDPRLLQDEVKDLLVEKLWDTIQSVWLRWSFTPSIPDIRFETYDDPRTGNKIIRWRAVFKYTPHQNFRYSQDLVEAIKDFRFY